MSASGERKAGPCEDPGVAWLSQKVLAKKGTGSERVPAGQGTARRGGMLGPAVRAGQGWLETLEMGVFSGRPAGVPGGGGWRVGAGSGQELGGERGRKLCGGSEGLGLAGGQGTGFVVGEGFIRKGWER